MFYFSNGQVRCFGYNDSAQLGYGDRVNRGNHEKTLQAGYLPLFYGQRMSRWRAAFTSLKRLYELRFYLDDACTFIILILVPHFY